MRSSLLPSFVLAAVASVAPAQPESAVDAVHAALEDYLRGLYDAAPERIERSVSPSLHKLGFWRDDENQRWVPAPMSYEQLVELAGRWNADGNRVGDGAVGRVEVFEVADDIACGQIEAVWGVDYAQLVREADGRWRIRHLLWQSWPDAPGARMAADAEAERAVERAGFDYLDGFYQAQPELTDRGVHPELVKVGVRHRDGAREEHPMTFDELRTLCATAYAEREKLTDPPRVVEVLDRRTHIALVRLVGVWGFDYMALADGEDGWQIRQVVWQPPPAEPPQRPVLAIADASNARCPFSGEPIVADALTRRRGQVVGFCKPDCRDRYARTPERFAEAVAKAATQR